MFFFVGVLRRIRIGIASQPKILDKLFAFFVGGKVDECASFFGGDYINDVFVQPLLILRIKLVKEVFVFSLLLLDGLLGVPLFLLFVLVVLLEGSGVCHAPES